MNHTVKLRAMEPEDLDLLYTIENDRQLWDVGTTNVPYSRYVLHDYIAHSSGDIYTDREVRLIIENEKGETVGIVDVTRFDAKNQRAEVGIVIVSTCRRQGYAYQALLEVMHYAHHILHLHQLYAVISCHNQPSIALFQKAGYSATATLHDWLYNGEMYHSAQLMQIFF